MNLRLLDIAVMNATLSINIIYSDRLVFLYIHVISGGIATLFITYAGGVLLVLFPFRSPKLGTSISDSMVLFLVTD